MSGTWPTSPNRIISPFMVYRTTPNFTRKLIGSKDLSMTRKKSIILNLRPMDRNMVTRLTMGLCLSQTPQYMATFGRMISTTGYCTPSTLRRDPRPELRGQDQDPRPGGGRRQPGEDGRPRDPEGGSEGAAPRYCRDSSRCLVHIVAFI